MTQDVGYVIAAYAASALLYGAYLVWLLGKERRLEAADRKGRP
jgi:hypothetical protein